MRSRWLVALITGSCLAVLAFNAPAVLATELLVGAAASLQDAFTEAGKAWSAGAKDRPPVSFDFAATSTLVRQIKGQAPLDVIVAADAANMDALAAAALIEPASRVDLLSNTVVLIVPVAQRQDAPPITAPVDLASPKVKQVALCEPAVPIGHYGHALLEHFGLAAQVEAKLVHPDDARASLALVASGAVDAGFVYATDAAMAPGKVRVVWSAGPGDGVDVRYPAAIVRSTQHAVAAHAFLAWLQTEQARQIFGRFGFK